MDCSDHFWQPRNSSHHWITGTSPRSSTQSVGQRAEARAQAYLERQGLALVVRNYRCKGGEIDLVMRAPDGTLVFVEVRARRGHAYGGAAASVTAQKQRRILQAANHYLAALNPANGALIVCSF